MSTTSSHARHRKGHKRQKAPGQPDVRSKLTAELTAEFCRLLVDTPGFSMRAACDFCGVSYSTVSDWIGRGEAEPETEYGTFVRAIKAANARGQKKVHLQALKRNPEFILARRFPEDYPAEKQRHELAGDSNSIIDFIAAQRQRIAEAAKLEDRTEAARIIEHTLDIDSDASILDCDFDEPTRGDARTAEHPQ